MKTSNPFASLRRNERPSVYGCSRVSAKISIQDTVSLRNRTQAAILTFVAQVWKSANLNSADVGSSLYQLCAYWCIQGSTRLRSCRLSVDASHDAKGSTTVSDLLETSEDSGGYSFLGSSFLQPNQSPLSAWLRTDSITGCPPQRQSNALFAKSSINALAAGSI